MSSSKIKGILQKINFIEVDIDVHRQILVSIPPKETGEMEKVIKKIAEKKKQIDDLRMEIKKTDADEYNKIIAIERATEMFQQIAKDKKFVQVDTLNETGECFITFNDGTQLECLVAAKEENGNWTVLTLDGDVKEYPHGFIK